MRFCPCFLHLGPTYTRVIPLAPGITRHPTRLIPGSKVSWVIDAHATEQEGVVQERRVRRASAGSGLAFLVWTEDD